MTEDHYATLGVEPRSEAAAIRAAYLALMRRYHPDKNDSPVAVERSHAIIAAFAVLGDVERRLHYDWGRRRAAEAAAEAQRSWRGWGPRAVLTLGAVLLLLVTVMVMPPVPVASPPPPPAAPASVDAAVAPPSASEAPASFPAPPLPAPEAPLDDGARPTRPAPVRLMADAPQPLATPRVAALPDKQLPRVLPAPRPAPAPPPPKAKCRSVRPGAEAAICNDDNLSALDGNIVTFYNQSLVFGTAAKRAALIDARSNFLARREACHSTDCLRALHLAHLREIAAIVENRAGAPAP